MTSNLARAALLLMLLVAASAWSATAAATSSYDDCDYYLEPHPDLPDPLRQNVNAPGTWCMRQDLVIPFNDYSYALVGVQADDVTIDCKGHKLALVGTGQLYGIAAGFSNRLTVRHCRMEGFSTAIYVDMNYIDRPGNGHVIEDNLLIGNRGGIRLSGTNVSVRRNRIFGSGGITVEGTAVVADNLVDGATLGYYGAIAVFNPTGGEVRGNVVRNLHVSADYSGGPIAGVYVDNNTSYPERGRVTIADNVILGDGNPYLRGASCPDARSTAIGNIVGGMADAVDGCGDRNNELTP